METALFATPRQRFYSILQSLGATINRHCRPQTNDKNKNQYLLTVVDEFSRFPFAFPLRNITSSSVIKCLSTLFAIFGTPGFIHSDRGTQFVSSEFQNFCRQNGVATSKTTPYHPQGNGQNERYNGIV